MHLTQIAPKALRCRRSELLRVRCSPALKTRLNQAAMRRETDLADIVRAACLAYLQPDLPAPIGHGSAPGN